MENKKKRPRGLADGVTEWHQTGICQINVDLIPNTYNMITNEFPKLSYEDYPDVPILVQTSLLVFSSNRLTYVEPEAGKRFELDLYAVDTDLGIVESQTHIISSDSTTRFILRLMPLVETFMLSELALAYWEYRFKVEDDLKYIHCRLKVEDNLLVMTFFFKRITDNTIAFTKPVVVPENLYI